MPYKVVGRNVYHKKGGKWSVKARAKSHRNAVKMVGLLHMRGYESRKAS